MPDPSTVPPRSAGRPLRLLLVEDSEDDAELVMRELERAGLQATHVRVRTQTEFLEALQTQGWDVIVSDHTLPQYGGLQALADLRATGKDIPFILVSGAIGEDVAVRAMKAGAQDYVLKGDLTRLPVAVEREVRDCAERAEQARVRERLIVSERMAAAGMLAAGVAHEINNPLAIAVVSTDLIAGMVSGLADIEEPLRDTQEALKRIRDVVRDVKLFSRPDDRTTGVVDVRRVVDSSVRMAWNEIRHRAQLVRHYDEVPLVRANESRLGQVILNLLLNAAQALTEGHADRNEIRVTVSLSADGRVVVDVADTGCGIARENLKRIFDPFFTTKPVGVGTGLGLTICHGIVTELGGRMEVESEVGKGTTFRLELPAAPASSSVMPVAPKTPLSGAVARVLLVDDEIALSRALRRRLAPHDVTVLSSGAEALELMATGRRFDAILLDVMMPEVSGMEVYERLRQTNPEQAARIIFVTGGAFSPASREFLDRVPNHRLEKPVDTATLLALLDGAVRT
jgi:signal transduction histidine kinase